MKNKTRGTTTTTTTTTPPPSKQTQQQHIDAAKKHSLVVAVAIKPPPFFYTRVVGVPLLMSHKIEMFSLERIKYSEPSRHEQKSTRTTSFQANSRAIGG